MASISGGLGGLFSGLSQGLQALIALRQAEENQRIARERTALMASQNQREQAAFDIEQMEAPYLNIQSKVLAPQNITASMPDIMREYTPPALGDTFQPTNEFAPSAFGSAAQQGGPPAPVPNLDTSHVAQVLQRAQRTSMHQRKMGTLQGILTAAAQQAQTTQQPVAGAFKTDTGESAELPEGFTAQPDRFFTPQQMGVGTNREADRLAKLITMVRARIPAKALELLDLGVKPGTIAKNKLFAGSAADLRYLVQLTAMYARAIGAPTGERAQAGAGAPVAAPKNRDSIINSVLQSHPDWSDEQIAAEVDRQMTQP